MIHTRPQRSQPLTLSILWEALGKVLRMCDSPFVSYCLVMALV